jgi:mevalonate kinase
MKFFLKDLSFSLIVDINGEIVETNADYIQNSQITLFNLNFGELLDNQQKLEELKKINPNNLKELKELMKDIPGIKIETNDPVVIKFR